MKSISIGITAFLLLLSLANSTTLIYDNFDDSSLNTSMWNLIVEDSSSFSETDGAAFFTVNTQRSELHSKNFSIFNWTYINISGRWKFTNPNTAEMRCVLWSNNISNFMGVYYATWTDYQHEHIRYFRDVNNKAVIEDKTIPTDYVNFSIIISKTGLQYWEKGILVKEISNSLFENSTSFYLEIGGFDNSNGDQYILFDEIKITSDGHNQTQTLLNNESLILTITNPEEINYLTNETSINITLLSSNNLTTAILEWNGTNESMQGEGKNWFSYKSELSDGTYYYRAYGVDIYGNENLTEIRNITIDSSPPVYSNVGQNKNVTTPGNPVDVYAFWEDNHLQKAWLKANMSMEGSKIWVNIGEMDLNSPSDWSNFTITPSNEDVGTYICWKIYANDSLNQVNVTPLNCFYVNESLAIINSSPSQNIYNKEGEQRVFNITLNQNATVKWYINGTLVKTDNNVNFSEYINTPSLPGNWNVSVFANNSNGNDSYEWNWTVNESLKINFVEPTPEDNSHLSHTTTQITIKAEANKEINSCILEWNGVNESFAPTENVCIKNKSVSSGNTYSFKLYAYSSNENASTEERTIFVNRPSSNNKNNKKRCFKGKKPFIIFSPEEKDYTSKDVEFSIKFGNYDFDEAFYSICSPDEKYTYKDVPYIERIKRTRADLKCKEIKKELEPERGEAYTYNIKIEKNKLFLLKVNAKDKCDDEYEERIYFTSCVYNNEPSITIRSPVEDKTYTNPEIIGINYRISDEDEKTLKTSIYLNGREIKGEEIPKEMLRDGENTFSIKAVDECGNKITKEIKFYVSFTIVPSDWVIKDRESCKNKRKVVNGNIFIEKEGELYLEDCDLFLNKSNARIVDNGSLISHNSRIHSKESDLRIISNQNSKFEIYNTEMEYFEGIFRGITKMDHNTLLALEDSELSLFSDSEIIGNTIKGKGDALYIYGNNFIVKGNNINVEGSAIYINYEGMENSKGIIRDNVLVSYSPIFVDSFKTSKQQPLTIFNNSITSTSYYKKSIVVGFNRAVDYVELKNNRIYGSVFVNSKNSLISSNSFYDKEIVLQNSDNVYSEISNNNFYGETAVSFSPSFKNGKVLIKSNRFYKVKNAFYYSKPFSYDLQVFFDLNFENNEFYSSNANILLLNHLGERNWHSNFLKIVDSNISLVEGNIECRGYCLIENSKVMSLLPDNLISRDSYTGFNSLNSQVRIENSSIELPLTIRNTAMDIENSEFLHPLYLVYSLANIRNISILDKRNAIELLEGTLHIRDSKFDGKHIAIKASNRAILNLSNSSFYGNDIAIKSNNSLMFLDSVILENNKNSISIKNSSFIIKNSTIGNSKRGISISNSCSSATPENKSITIVDGNDVYEFSNNYVFEYKEKEYNFKVNDEFFDAYLYLRYNHEIEVYINGKSVFSDFSESGLYIKDRMLDITKYVHKGNNKIKIVMKLWYNDGDVFDLRVILRTLPCSISNSIFVNNGLSIYSKNSSISLFRNHFSLNDNINNHIYLKKTASWISNNVIKGGAWGITTDSYSYVKENLFEDVNAIYSSTTTEILKNTFKNSNIQLSTISQNSHTSLIKDNLFVGGLHGISLYGGGGEAYKVVGNLFYDIFQPLRFYFTNNKSYAKNNTFFNTTYGVFYHNSNSPSTNNRFILNEKAIYVETDNPEIELRENTFFDNTYDLYLNGNVDKSKLNLNSSYTLGVLKTNKDDIIYSINYSSRDKIDRGSGILKAAILSINSTNFWHSSYLPSVGGVMVIETYSQGDGRYLSYKIEIRDENGSAVKSTYGIMRDGINSHVIDIHDLRDGVYELYFEIRNLEGYKIYAKTPLLVGNSRILIEDVSIKNAKHIYSYFGNPDKAARVVLRIKNNGTVGGFANIKIELPSYLKQIKNKLSRTVFLNPGEERNITFVVKLTEFDFKNGWRPSNYSVFPSDKKIPIRITATNYPAFIEEDSRNATIDFTLGPILKVCFVRPNSWIKWGTANQPFDGDGDGILEAGEEYHLDFAVKNVGDEKINVSRLVITEMIYTKTQNYWKNFKRDLGYISNYNDYMEGVDDVEKCYEVNGRKYCELARIYGILEPSDDPTCPDNLTYFMRGKRYDYVYMRDAYMDQWPSDLSRGVYSPMNYTGAVDIYFMLEGKIGNREATLVSINRKPIYVVAFNKTFTPIPYLFKKNYVKITANSVDVNKGLVNFDIKNSHDSVYFVYMLDGAWDNDSKGYAWSNILPPDVVFKATAYHAKDPNKNWPSFRVKAGVKWSESMNLLALGLKGVEQVINAILDSLTDGAASEADVQVEFSDKVMSLIRTALILNNAWDTVGKQNATLNEFEINGVKFTKADFERMAKKGLDQKFFEGLKKEGLNRKRAFTLIKVLGTEKKVLLLYYNTMLSIASYGLYSPMDASDEASFFSSSEEEQISTINDEILDYASDKVDEAAEEGRIGEAKASALTSLVEALGYSIEWAMTNAAVAGKDEYDIIIDDPPGTFVGNLSLPTSNYFGGVVDESGKDGKAKLSVNIKRNGLVEFVGKYTIPKNKTALNRIKRFTIDMSGKRNEYGMYGNIDMVIEADGNNLLNVLLFVKNKELSRMFISQYFNELYDYDVELINNSIVEIKANGLLMAPKKDVRVEAHLFAGKDYVYLELKREGYYLSEENKTKVFDAKFTPRLGVALENTSLNITSEVPIVLSTSEGIVKNVYSYEFSSTPKKLKASFVKQGESNYTNLIEKQSKEFDYSLIIFLILLFVVIVIALFLFKMKK